MRIPTVPTILVFYGTVGFSINLTVYATRQKILRKNVNIKNRKKRIAYKNVNFLSYDNKIRKP